MEKILTEINAIVRRKNNINDLINIINTVNTPSYQLSPGLPDINDSYLHNAGMQLIYSMQDITDYIISKENEEICTNKNDTKTLNVIKLLKLMRNNASDTKNKALSVNGLNPIGFDLCQYIEGYTHGTVVNAYIFISSILSRIPGINHLWKIGDKKYTYSGNALDTTNYSAWPVVDEYPPVSDINPREKTIQDFLTDPSVSVFHAETHTSVYVSYTSFGKYLLLPLSSEYVGSIDETLILSNKTYILTGVIVIYSLPNSPSHRHVACIKHNNRWFEYHNNYRSTPYGHFQMIYPPSKFTHSSVLLYTNIPNN